MGVTNFRPEAQFWQEPSFLGLACLFRCESQVALRTRTKSAVSYAIQRIGFLPKKHIHPYDRTICSYTVNRGAVAEPFPHGMREAFVSKLFPDQYLAFGDNLGQLWVRFVDGALPPSAVDRIWQIKDSQGQILSKRFPDSYPTFCAIHRRGCGPC